MLRIKLLHLTFSLLLLCSSSCFGAVSDIGAKEDISHIPMPLALSIGLRVWYNESGAKISGLTAWNSGEDFASLGIGHFIWRPKNSGIGDQNDSFVMFLLYLQQYGVKMPVWLGDEKITSCPWRTRTEFLLAQKSRKMQELRQFLIRTIPFQVKYIMHRFESVLPRLLAAFSPKDSEIIYQELVQLLQTPQGTYALVDYLNFKGDGVVAKLRHRHGGVQNCGLAQVLDEMRFAPKNLTPLEAYSWAARKVLVRRIFYAAPHRHEEKWIQGWLRRIDSYHKTD